MPQKRRRRRSSRHLPPAYSWVKGISIFWLIGGCLFVFVAVMTLMTESSGGSAQQSRALIGLGLVMGVWHILIPVGLLLRTKWGFYGGLILSCLLMVGIPIGTILGIVTLKALNDCKSAFPVR